MTKERQLFTPEQKREYAKLMVHEGYSNKEVMEISGACQSAVTRWKSQYKAELSGKTPSGSVALTPEHREIQHLKKQLYRARRDNDILKKAAAFFIRENRSLT